jgi:choline dehydrogenase
MSRLLSQYGIKTKVALPAVGENMQDQMNSVLKYTSSQEFDGITPYTVFPTAAQVLGSTFSSPTGEVEGWVDAVSAYTSGFPSKAAFDKIFRVQLGLMFNQSVPVAEVYTGVSASTWVSSFNWLQMPFSRGSVHIGSTDPLKPPVIDPRFGLVDFDLQVGIATAKYAKQ